MNADSFLTEEYDVEWSSIKGGVEKNDGRIDSWGGNWKF